MGEPPRRGKKVLGKEEKVSLLLLTVLMPAY